MLEGRKCTIGDLIDEGVIVLHKDGNHGSNYPRVEDFGDEGLPFLTAKSLSDWKIDFKNAPRLSVAKARTFKFGFVRAEDILLSHNATVGRVAVVPEINEPAVIGTSLTQFRVDPKKMLPRFLAIYFSSREFQNQLSFVMAQTTRNQVPITEQRRLPIQMPPMATQKAITEITFCLIDKIELNRQINETLEAMARAVFKDWFVDFGPTRAKAEGRPPYLTPDLWALFPDRLGDEGSPKGWRLGALEDIVQLNPSEPLKTGIAAPYLDMAALPTSGPIPDQAVSREFTSGMRFRNGDTLLARITPCLENGKTAFVQSLPNDTVGWGSTEFIVLRSKGRVPSAYTYLLARDSTFRACAIQSMTGTSGRQRARNEALAAYPVAIPGEDIWPAFGSLIQPLFARIKENGAESSILSETRDLLLPKLMSGEIRIRDVEKTIEAAS
jgi:type I restriction enzyme S subunit